MKRMLVVLFTLLLVPAYLTAQGGVKLSYDDFRIWMKQSVVNGYSFVDSDNENGEYSASFMQLNRLISVKVMSGNKFDTYKNVKGFDGEQPYDFKGVKAVFVNGTSSSVFYILSAKLNATISISTMYCKFDKQTMEKAATELGVGARL